MSDRLRFFSKFGVVIVLDENTRFVKFSVFGDTGLSPWAPEEWHFFIFWTRLHYLKAHNSTSFGEKCTKNIPTWSSFNTLSDGAKDPSILKVKVKLLLNATLNL